ncbi:hypothetical protein ES708_03228 [subsurface metagenome]
MSRRGVVASGALLGVAHLLDVVLPLLRNVAIARLMEPREFALSLMLTTVVVIAELVTDTGLSQMAVKVDPSRTRARGTLQSLAVLRALLVGGALAVVSGPLATLFHEPAAAAAFALTGAGIAVRGASNVAMKQAGRDFNFAPEALTLIVSQIVWTASCIGLAVLWGDHRAMTASLMLYCLSFAVVSHLTAPKRVTFAWDRVLVGEAARFGAPLMPNGIALAVTSLGDRGVIGARLGLEALAAYGPVNAMAMLPRGTALRYVNNLFLPAMVRATERGEPLAGLARGWAGIMALLAVGLGLGFMALGKPTVALIYGGRYDPSQALVSVVAALLATRVLIALPVPLAVANGRTWFVTASSAITALSLVPAAALLLMMPVSLVAFLGAVLAVEALGLTLILARTACSFGAEGRALARVAPLAAGLCYGSIGLLHALGLADRWDVRLTFGAAGAAVALLAYGPAFLRSWRLRR